MSIRGIPNHARRVGAAGTAVALLTAGAACLGAPAQAATSNSAAPVRIGHAPSAPRGATQIAAPSDSQALNLDVVLKPRNGTALTNFISAVSTPGSSAYHQYLSKGQFATYFGATQDTINATEAALKAQGLTVGSVSADKLTISVSTTVGKAKTAFGTGFAGFRLADGRTAYANSSAPQLAGGIAGNVSGIVGLDDLSTYVSHAVKSGKSVPVTTSGAKARSNAARPNYTAPSVCSALTTSLNQNGLFDGAQYYSPSSLSSIYGMNTNLAAGNNGNGVSVGVFELENYDPTGMANYESCLGISTPVSVAKVDGGATTAPNEFTGEGIETALDVETLASLAPGISIIDYQGPDNATDAQVLDTYRRMVTDDAVKVISSSWGLCEAASSSATISAENTIFQEAAADGQTVIAASGDNGSNGCSYINNTNPPTFVFPAQAAALNTDDPASQPYVLGVGGTGLQGLSNPSVSVWNTTSGTDPTTASGGASGGGVSTVWPLASYQSGFTGAGYASGCSTASSTGCREVPDVAALANPNDGYLLDEYYNNGTTTPTPGDYVFIFGGTSAAAPLWAAVTALADASKDCAGNGSVGFVNPALYAAAKAGTTGVLSDVTTGNNVVSFSGYTGSLYQAGSGYDLTTGLGEPVSGGVTKTLCNSVGASKASYFVPVTPTRLLDTRNGTGGITGKLGANATDHLTVAGAGGVSAAATSIVASITVTNTGGSGFITAYPDGTALPNASNVNFTGGQTVANLAVIPVGADGKIALTNSGSTTGPTDVIVDVSGYFIASSSTANASTFTALSPTRIIDTRSGTNGISGKLGVKATDSIKVQSLQGIAAGATAVVAHVTVTNTTGPGFVTAFPTGGTVPNVSNVNFLAGQTIANSAIIPVGSNGSISFTNDGSGDGPVDLIVDITGYFTAGTSGQVFHAGSPARVLDTRGGLGTASAAPIGAHAGLNLSLGDSGTALVNASAIIGNLTVVNPQGPGFITAYPTGGSVPNASNVNFLRGQVVPNLAVMPVGAGGSVSFFNDGSGDGPTDLIVDVSGYFSAS